MNSQNNNRGRMRYLSLIFLVCIFIVLAICLSVSVGSVSIRTADIFKIIANRVSRSAVFTQTWETNTETIIWSIRLPRVLMAFIVGAGLSVCGVLMQALTKNSLADPYVLGISSGASAGAVASIVLGLFSFMGSYATMSGAIVGAALSIIMSLGIASYNGKITSTQLILAGIATSALFSGITNLIIYGRYTGSDKTKTAQYWMVGSLSGASWDTLKYVALAFAIAIIIILLFARELDVLLLGDEVAENLGVNTGRIKRVVILMSTILTGIVVSVSGVIGFIGLVIPHVVRSLTGSKHIRLIPLSILSGGLFTMLVDTASRVIAAPEELPIGIISSLIGAPFFLHLIRKGRRQQ